MRLFQKTKDGGASNVTDLTSKPTEFNGCELHHLNKINEALIKMEERDAKQ